LGDFGVNPITQARPKVACHLGSGYSYVNVLIGAVMATLTLRIPDELDRELERQSAAVDQSKSDLACEALQRFLRVGKLKLVRDQAVPEAKAAEIRTDDDVFQKLTKP
jgi:predicted transcriptional regulator